MVRNLKVGHRVSQATGSGLREMGYSPGHKGRLGIHDYWRFGKGVAKNVDRVRLPECERDGIAPEVELCPHESPVRNVPSGENGLEGDG